MRVCQKNGTPFFVTLQLGCSGYYVILHPETIKGLEYGKEL